MVFDRFQDKKFVFAISASLMLCCPALADDAAIAPAGEEKAQQAETKTEAASASTTGGAVLKPAATTSEPGLAQQTYADRLAADQAAQEHRTAAEAARRAEEQLRKGATTNIQATASQPLKLYGRIEELSSATGARIPLKMQALTPVRDSSLDRKLAGKAATLAGSTSAMQSYPMDYRGSWSGEITVNSTNFDPSYFQYDAAEARKESELMKPGIKGHYTVTFFQGNNNKIQMRPSQVMFQGTDSASSQIKLLEKRNPQMSALFGANNPMVANMQMPIMFALHMGTPISAAETGVTGNQVSSELMKSSLKELSKGVLESQTVTRESDRNPDTGKVQNGFSESVLRFTRLNNEQLYLQAAYVYYRSDGHFQSKYIFYGTLDRSNGQTAGYPSQLANPFGGLIPGMGSGANPFGGMLPGTGGGTGSLQEQMNQMQNMLKKMSGQ